MENTTEITVPEGMEKKEWFKTKEFVKGVGTSTSAFNRWLKVHPDFVQKYCQNVGHGSLRPRYLILWKGIIAYVNEYGKTRRAKKIEDKLSTISDAKKMTTELAIQKVEDQKAQPLSPAQALLQAVQLMVGLEEKLNGVVVRSEATETKLVQLEEKIDETLEIATAPIPVTAGQRQFLNDRVRKYCAEQEVPHYIIWRQLHEYVGVHDLNNYQLKHYKSAFKYLKEMYQESGLLW